MIFSYMFYTKHVLEYHNFHDLPLYSVERWDVGLEAPIAHLCSASLSLGFTFNSSDIKAAARTFKSVDYRRGIAGD